MVPVAWVTHGCIIHGATLIIASTLSTPPMISLTIYGARKEWWTRDLQSLFLFSLTQFHLVRECLLGIISSTNIHITQAKERYHGVEGQCCHHHRNVLSCSLRSSLLCSQVYGVTAHWQMFVSFLQNLAELYLWAKTLLYLRTPTISVFSLSDSVVADICDLGVSSSDSNSCFKWSSYPHSLSFPGEC